jgi:uncharacterized protein with NRDE domain
LGGYDLHRPAHGTWLGMTKQGRIAVLTNYREEHEELATGARSRGLVPNAWLKSNPTKHETPEQFAKRLVEEEGVKGIGGFSLCYGFAQDVVKDEVDGTKRGLAIISNRTPDAEAVIHLAKGKGETHALSNAAYGDRTWPKVVNGEKWTKEAIAESVSKKESRDQLVQRLLAVLSTDTMPKHKENEDWDMYMNQLRHSVFVPEISKDGLDEMNMPAHEIGDVVKHKAADATSGCYGTEKQIVILVDKEGKAFYLERTLYDGDAKPIPKGEGDRTFEFQIEDW